MRKHPFVNDCYYHVFNRGVLKQPIFFEKSDYLRFLHDLYEFNNVFPAPHDKRGEIQSRRVREPLVSILAWCLMPNHFHLFLKQKVENGVSLFMQKLGIGYTTYINKKYDRSGHLFQGRFKTKMIDSDAYLFHISRYIHCNPLDLFDPDWEHGLDATKRQDAQKFLSAYPWSSYKNWIGDSPFSSVIDMNEVTSFTQDVDYSAFLFEHLYR